MEKDALLPSQFTSLPRTNAKNGLHGYYLVPLVGAFYDVLDGAYVKNSLLAPDTREPNYLPRPDSDQYLQMWTDDELKVFKLNEAAASGGSATGKSGASTNNKQEESSGQNQSNSKTVEMPRNIRFLPESDPDGGFTRL